MALALFWISLCVIIYAYLGYPLLLMVWQRVGRRPVRKGSREPRVSLIVAAHNERDNIERKIANCLELDYPRDKLQVIISLDGPTDGTERLVWRQAGRGIDVVYSPIRRGKAAALNRAVAEAEGDVILFADARQLLDRRAVRELVANLCDGSVGGVTGELVLLDEEGREASDGVGLYWRYEKRLRAMESNVHSVLGATGAIYCIRRDLFQPLPEGMILDDVAIPMRIILGGKRVVFEPKARAYDGVASSPEQEYRRKVRTLMGNYQLLAEMPELLLPWRNPVFWQFASHKIGRLVVPYFLALLFASNLFLLQGPYLASFVLQLGWYLLALAGKLLATRQGGRQKRQRLALEER